MNRPQLALRTFLIELYAWRPGRLASGTLAMTAGMGLRTLAQAVIFLIVARVLGAAEYGAFAAVLALSSAFGCFSGCGTQVLMVRDVSRNFDCFSAAWGRALAAIVMSSPVLLALYIPFACAVLPVGVPLAVIALIGLADLVFAPVGLSAITAYQGYERLGRAAHLSLMPVLPRLAGALLMLPLAVVLPDPMHLTAWAIVYAVTSIVATQYAWRLVRKELGRPSKPAWLDLLGALRAGWAFAFGAAAVKIYADIDKTMLARLLTLEIAGAYSAGYRVADLATVPVLSFISAAMPRLFRNGISGVQSTLLFTCRILPAPFAYCILAGLVLYLSAGLLPLLLGEGYADAVPILRWLAWLPALSLPRLLLQSLLIGGDRQNHAVNILAGGGILNIALNLWLIPIWSWRGAVTATYAAEMTMALAMFAVALLLKDKHNLPPSGK